MYAPLYLESDACKEHIPVSSNLIRKSVNYFYIGMFRSSLSGLQIQSFTHYTDFTRLLTMNLQGKLSYDPILRLE